MKKFLVNMFLVICSFCIGLLLCEGTLVLKNRNMKNYDIEMWRYSKLLKKRSADPILGHEHRYNKEALLESVSIRTNNFGLRGPDIEEQCTKKRRILFLGSSMTLGWGVPEAETFSDLLSQNLGNDVEVLNAGIGNYNTVRYVELFMTKLKVLNPTDIVIDYAINDTEVLHDKNANWFLRNSQLAVTLWQLYHKIAHKYTVQDMVSYYKSCYQPDSKGYIDMIAALDKITTYAREHNIRLYLVLRPDFTNITDYKYGFIDKIMKRESLKRDIKYLDLFPAFDGVTDPSSFLAMPNDFHCNGKANRMMVEYALKNNFFTISE